MLRGDFIFVYLLIDNLQYTVVLQGQIEKVFRYISICFFEPIFDLCFLLNFNWKTL